VPGVYIALIKILYHKSNQENSTVQPIPFLLPIIISKLLFASKMIIKSQIKILHTLTVEDYSMICYQEILIASTMCLIEGRKLANKEVLSTIRQSVVLWYR